jgi:hypothetical protein
VPALSNDPSVQRVLEQDETHERPDFRYLCTVTARYVYVARKLPGPSGSDPELARCALGCSMLGLTLHMLTVHPGSSTFTLIIFNLQPLV